MDHGRFLTGLSLGSGRSSSSKNKGRKSSSDQKPKQPQRGLGVAQLEKIRLQNQMSDFYVSSPVSHEDLNTEDSRVEIVSSSSPSSSSPNLGLGPASSLFAAHPNTMIMAHGETERRSFSYGDQYWPNTSTSSKGSSSSPHYFPPPSAVTLPLFEEEAEKKNRRVQHDRSLSLGSSISDQNSESAKQEVDLELRLSL